MAGLMILWLKEEAARKRKQITENLLSRGAIAAIYRGEHVDCPVLQFLSYTRSYTFNREDKTESWKLVLSDGHHCCYATCADKHKRKLTSGQLAENAAIKLSSYTYNGGHIFVQDMRIVKRGVYIEQTIGDPTFIVGPDVGPGQSGATGSPGAATPSAAIGSVERPSGDVGPAGDAGPSRAAGSSRPLVSGGAVRPSAASKPSGSSESAGSPAVAKLAGSSGAARPATAAGPSGKVGPAVDAGPSGVARSSKAIGSAGAAIPSAATGSFSKPSSVAESSESPGAARPIIAGRPPGDVEPAGDAGQSRATGSSRGIGSPGATRPSAATGLHRSHRVALFYGSPGAVGSSRPFVSPGAVRLSTSSKPSGVTGSSGAPGAESPTTAARPYEDTGRPGDAESSEASTQPAAVNPDVDLGTVEDAGPSGTRGSSTAATPSGLPGLSQGPSCSRSEMSDKGEKFPQGLMCPLCLDAFKSPTLLACGHTFCKDCLDRYDDQHKHRDYMECPVCRKRTKLAQDRVAGLASNFSVKVLDDEIRGQGEGESSNFCPLHSPIYRDIWCEDCNEFICLTCFLDKHQGHKIKKKEELDAELKKKRDSLIQKSREKKAKIDKSITDAEQHRLGVQTHFDNLKGKVRLTLIRKTKILKENAMKLLTKLNDMQSYHDKLLQTCIADQKQSVVTLSSSLTILAGAISKCSDSDSLKAHRVQFSDLEKSLTKITDPVSTAYVKETAEMTNFVPNNGNVFDVGFVELRGEATVSLVEGAKLAHIVRNIVLPYNMSGMAALSQNAVVIGYGVYGVYGKGTDCYFVSGGKRPHMTRKMDEVCDVAFLSDRSSVVSHNKKTCCRYDPRRHDESMEYTCKPGRKVIQLCSDHNDNIYAVNGNAEIYMFHGKSPEPQRVVSTGNTLPRQICVAKTGVMITSTCDTLPSTITTYDGEGRVGSTIPGSDQGEHLYATVDAHDRVVVARVVNKDNMLRLTRYTLQGSKLVIQVVFKQLQLSDRSTFWPGLCYIASLTPNMLAFAHANQLYFIKLTSTLTPVVPIKPTTGQTKKGNTPE